MEAHRYIFERHIYRYLDGVYKSIGYELKSCDAFVIALRQVCYRTTQANASTHRTFQNAWNLLRARKCNVGANTRLNISKLKLARSITSGLKQNVRDVNATRVFLVREIDRLKHTKRLLQLEYIRLLRFSMSLNCIDK